MEFLKWNTGRKYTDAGQEILAKKTDRGIIFKDRARMIYGLIRNPKCEFTQKAVMAEYDAGNFDWDAEAMALKEPERASIKRVTVQQSRTGKFKLIYIAHMADGSAEIIRTSTRRYQFAYLYDAKVTSGNKRGLALYFLFGKSPRQIQQASLQQTYLIDCE